MSRRADLTQKLVRQAFGLILELRAHEEAPRLLSKAISFLEMLARERDSTAPPVMVSVRVLRLPKP